MEHMGCSNICSAMFENETNLFNISDFISHGR